MSREHGEHIMRECPAKAREKVETERLIDPRIQDPKVKGNRTSRSKSAI